MLVQRKLLTSKQKNNICNKYYDEGKGCSVCPLRSWSLGEHYCIYNLDQIQYAIQDYLNEEIEVNE